MDLSTIRNSLSTFEKISELVMENNLNTIIDTVAQGLKKNYISAVPLVGCTRSKTNRHYCFVLKDLKENLHHLRWLYDKLNEPRSREVFLNLIRYRILPEAQFLRNACDHKYDQYFDHDIVHCDKDEVFVDCGGFTGDTVQSFIQNFTEYKHIYTYEPSVDNMKRCMQTVSMYKKITAKPFGVGKKEEVIAFAQTGSSSSFIIDHNNIKKAINMKITSLDTDIAEPVSFIKMDIEGFEVDALIGAKRHILNDHPKLAICVYHLPSDIWEIPRLIDTINPDYDFFLRQYSETQSWETVVYAIPKIPAQHMELQSGKTGFGVYAINGFFGGWTNQELTKGCGMIPFMFYKKYGCRAVMVSTKTEEYPYLNTCVKGMIMDYIPDRSIQTRCQYISDHYRDMDILVLYGPYPQYYTILETYRKLRPDGKVYLALDANSAWMDKIHWDDPAFLTFMDRCDVIAERCKRMQRHLSIKWPYKIEYIPNGYYEFPDCDLTVDLSAKENIILTVGRIGTYQKNNEVMLEAFSQISEKIPGWSLHLVGCIDNAFQDYIKRYFERNPHLKDRVIFTGIIEDKRKLLTQYQKAKIFILTSRGEGLPNVIPEALISGCYMITSDVDASGDITDGGNCGKVFPIGDLTRLAHILVEVCNNEELVKTGGSNSIEYARYVYDYQKIVGRLHYLLFAEE